MDFVKKIMSRQGIREVWAIARGTVRACLRIIDETAGVDQDRCVAVQEALAANRHTMRSAAQARLDLMSPRKTKPSSRRRRGKA